MSDQKVRDVKAARDWSRLRREGVAEGVTDDNMDTYIADNTTDPRTRGGFPPGYHQLISDWLVSQPHEGAENARANGPSRK